MSESAYSDYKRINTILAEQVEHVEGTSPQEGDRVEYVFTKKLWQQHNDIASNAQSKQVVSILSLLGSRENINMEKYREQIERALSLFKKSTVWANQPNSILELL